MYTPKILYNIPHIPLYVFVCVPLIEQPLSKLFGEMYTSSVLHLNKCLIRLNPINIRTYRRIYSGVRSGSITRHGSYIDSVYI